MIKHESQFGLIFRSWWRSNRMPGVFELKDTRGKFILPFSAVEDAQMDSAFANESAKGNLVRVSSGTAGTGDYISLVKYPSYIVINYPHFFAIINIKIFFYEKENCKRKSLTQKRARDIANFVIPYPKKLSTGRLAKIINSR